MQKLRADPVSVKPPRTGSADGKVDHRLFDSKVSVLNMRG
jgi:hypothetical protein